MSTINHDDVIAQMVALGLDVDKPLNLDAKIQRWRTADSGRETPGWSRLREWMSKAGHIYIVGSFGIWVGNDSNAVKVELPKKDSSRPAPDPDDITALRAALKASSLKQQAERKAEEKQAAQWAAQVWSHGSTCTDHEYTTRKRIKPHGLRVLESIDGIRIPGIDDGNWWRLTKSIGALMVPMHDAHGNVCGLQLIYPRGHELRTDKTDKGFWPRGMAMGGTFGVIGPISRSGVLLIAEGYATAASLHEATGQSVAYAFSANNLGKAGKLLRKVYPQLKLLICADDDYLTDGNPGVSAAVAATAELEKSAWTKPDFTDATGADPRGGKKLTDYNDLAVLTGLPLVLADQINAKLDELKWRDAQPMRAEPVGEGGGEDNGRRRALSVMPLDEAVKRFIPVDDGTGKYVFDTWTNKIASRDQMIALLPAGMRGDDIKRHPLYIERGAYYLDQIGFDPSGKDAGVQLNTWRGWPMKPKPGSCDRLRELLGYLCSADSNAETLTRWVERWMAYPLQHPGAKMASAIIMHGPQGTGKSTVWQCLAKIYGDYATVLNQRGLEDRFNSDWVDSKLFILAEEVVTRAEMWHIKNELKELISGEWIRVNPKNVAAYRQRNQVNGVFLSNENQPLPLDNDDRRHCVIYTPPPVSESFYDDVHLEIENGGVEALYHYLLNLDLGDFHPKKRPPMTEAKTALIALSTPSEIRFAVEWTSGELGLPVCPALSTDVYAAYLRWCRSHGEMRPRPDNQFHGALARMAGWEKRKARIYPDLAFLPGTDVPRTITIPPASAIDKRHAHKEGSSQPVWLTESVIAFANALHDGDAKKAFA